MSLARALALNTGVQILGKVVSTALGIVIVGLMTRILGTEGFGAYSTANAFLQVFALILDLGLNVTLVALLGEHAGDEAYEKRCTSALFTLRVIMAVLILGIIAPVIALASPYPPELKLTIIALIGAFLFPSINQVVTGAQQRHLKMAMNAVSENVGRLVVLAGLLLALQYHWNIVTIMWFISLAALANFTLNILSAKRYASFQWNWDPSFWKMALSRSWPVGLSIAFGLIYFKADTLILSFIRPQAEVGIYGAAYRVLEILITVPFMYAGVLLPILSNAYAKKDHKKFQNWVSNSIDIMLIFILPMMAGTWIMGERIMSLVAGPEFAESGRIMSILIVAVSIIYLNTIFSHIVVAIDAQRRMIPTYIAVAIAAVAGYLAFIPSFGMYAAAWLTVASELCVGLGSLIISHQAVPIIFKKRVLIAAIGATILMSAAIWPLRTQFVGIPLFVAIIVYAGALYGLGGINKETLREIISAKSINPPVM